MQRQTTPTQVLATAERIERRYGRHGGDIPARLRSVVDEHSSDLAALTRDAARTLIGDGYSARQVADWLDIPGWVLAQHLPVGLAV